MLNFLIECKSAINIQDAMTKVRQSNHSLKTPLTNILFNNSMHKTFYECRKFSSECCIWILNRCVEKMDKLAST